MMLKATVPAFAVTGAGWAYWHQPGHLPGLGVAEALTVVLVTRFVLLPPQRWRRWYRHRYTRESQRSARISTRLRRRVLAADRYRCVSCGIRETLQIDHVFPWSLGGLTRLWNLVTLCEDCNLSKSNYWRYRDGYIVYRSFEGYNVPGTAAAILAREKQARRNPLRWARAAWAY